jgi:hypothetical protein
VEITITGVSLTDALGVPVDEDDMDGAASITLGDVVAQALLDRLTRDPRWGDLAQRFADAADAYLAAQAPGFVEALVAGEVARQLESTRQGAMRRGVPSTRAEAIVATEVTTQLRAAFADVVVRAMNDLDRELRGVSADAITAFRKGSGT